MKGMKKFVGVVVSLLFVMIVASSSVPADPGSFENMVKIGNFYMDKYEFPNKIGEYPVTNVTWYEAKALCESVGKRFVYGCRMGDGLPRPAGTAFPMARFMTAQSAIGKRVDAPMRIGDTPKTV